MKRSGPFDIKFKRSNSGLFYLIVIALSVAIAANAFNKDGGILLLPIGLVVALILGSLFLRHFARGN